jgi:hypothetical protein
MRTFVFHIEDDRSAIAAVRKASTCDELAAQKLAKRMLCETYHHRSVEVLEAGRRICRLAAQEA